MTSPWRRPPEAPGSPRARAVPGARSRATAGLLAALLCAACDGGLLDPVSPAVVADAGPDLRVAPGESVELDGSHSRLAPLDLWLADGSGPNENKLIHYSSDGGVSAAGPLRTVEGIPFAYPSDLVRIDGRVYGVDTYRRQLYLLHPRGARVQPLGSPSSYRHLGALAWDAEGRTLYAVDAASRKLLIADPVSGDFRLTGHELPGRATRGLAFDPRARLLYALDRDLRLLYSIDPSNGRWGSFVELPVEGDGEYDELAHQAGRLFGLYRQTVDGTPLTQLRRIDPVTGEVRDVGPALARVSPRCLLVDSVPEDLRWSRREGPGEVVFEDPYAVVTRARFEREGRYEIELAIEADGTVARSTSAVQVTAPEPR